MPEGPETRRIADLLARQIAGRVIDHIFFGIPSLAEWQDRLTGCRVGRIETRGKSIVIHLDNGMHIYCHSQLYGRWYFCSSNDYPNIKRQLRLAIKCQGRSALLYSASDIAVLTQSELRDHPLLRKLGPDVLDKSTTPEAIVGRLNSARYRNRQLGGVLTDQSFVAGLGNYLRCEILFYASLHPGVRSCELNEMQLFMLADAIIKLTRRSYQTGGITNDPDHAKQLQKQGATFEDARFFVFRRQELPCYRCGSLIEKSMQSGQACYRCPECQTA